MHNMVNTSNHIMYSFSSDLQLYRFFKRNIFSVLSVLSMTSIWTVTIPSGSIYLGNIPHIFNLQFFLCDYVVMNKKTIDAVFITVHERIIMHFP